MRALALIPVLFSLSCADLSAVNSEPLCDAAPAMMAIPSLDEAEVAAWAEAARCRTYLLRRDARSVAVAEDFESASTLAASLPDQARDLRDHFELLMAALAMEQADPGCDAEPGEATTRHGDAYAPVCFGGRDVSERIFDTISWIVEHAGFARDGRNQTMCTRHAEHVLNCLQTPEPLDWNWDGEVEEVCDGRLADFGFSGGPGEVGSFITMMVEQAKR